MRIPNLFSCCVGMILLLQGCAAAPQIQDRYSEYRRVEESAISHPFSKRATMISDAYERLFSSYEIPGDLQNLPPDEIELLMEATKATVIYTLDPVYARQHGLLLKELEKRGLTTNSHYKEHFRALISSGQFEQARQLAEQKSSIDVEPVPEFVTAAGVADHQGPTEWIVDRNNFQLIRKAIELDDETLVIVTAHPYCHFTQDAAQSINSTPWLREIFRQHSKWIVPRDHTLPFGAVREWNVRYPGLDMSLAVSRDEWHFIDEWRTPVFYFVSDNQLVDKVVGWPDEGRESELESALKKLGLL